MGSIDRTQLEKDLAIIQTGLDLTAPNAYFNKTNAANPNLSNSAVTPVAVLVAKETIMESALQHAAVFLFNDNNEINPPATVHAFVALSPDTKMEHLQELEREFGALLFQKNPSEPFCGYIGINRGDGSTPDFQQQMDDLKMCFSRNSIKTQPIPFDTYGVGSLPMFLEEGNLTNQLSRENVAKEIGKYFTDNLSVFDLPYDVVKMAQEQSPAWPEPDYHRNMDNAPRPTMR